MSNHCPVFEVVKLKGEFVSHADEHEDEDELFLVAHDRPMSVERQLRWFSRNLAQGGGREGAGRDPEADAGCSHHQPGQEMLFELPPSEIVMRKSAGVPLKGRFAGSGFVEVLAQERREERERDARRT